MEDPVDWVSGPPDTAKELLLMDFSCIKDPEQKASGHVIPYLANRNYEKIKMIIVVLSNFYLS